MSDLTKRQREIVAYIANFHAAHRYAPSIRDIQEGCGLSSTSVAEYNINRLEEMGYITRQPGLNRTIVVNEEMLID